MNWVRSVCAFALLALSVTAGAAQDVANFYKGKTITLLMGTGPGGSYDLYGRTIADHFGRHIPGNPTFIVEPPAWGGRGGGRQLHLWRRPAGRQQDPALARAAPGRKAGAEGRSVRIGEVQMAGDL